MAPFPGSRALSGFKDFIMRGNVVDLAVGIVIGAAFTALVSSFTGSFIEPLIKVFGGGGKVGGTFTVNSQTFDWAAFVNAMITFLITAAVLYFFVVLPMNTLAERRKRGEEAESQAPSDEVRLLTEIRDALVADNLPRQRAVAENASPAPDQTSAR